MINDSTAVIFDPSDVFLGWQVESAVVFSLPVFIWILPMSTKRGPPHSHIKRDYKCQWRISTQQHILGLFQTDDKHQGFHQCINSSAARWGQAGSMPVLTTGNWFFWTQVTLIELMQSYHFC